jgi:CRP/FNR family transcriptional regulator, cyclic AMP receptor protein
VGTVRVGSEQAWPESTLLGSLPVGAREALLAAGTELPVLPDGKRLVVQGADDDHAYLLLRGMVKVAARDQHGRSALLAIRLAGDLVGEMGALDRAPRSADVTATGPVMARVYSAAELQELSRRRSEISLGITRMVGRRLRWANERRLDFTARSSHARVARILYEVIRAYGSNRGSHWVLGVQLTQAEIASLASVRLRTAEKVLSGLYQDGVLVRRYRDIHVVNLDELKRVADG